MAMQQALGWSLPPLGCAKLTLSSACCCPPSCACSVKVPSVTDKHPDIHSCWFACDTVCVMLNKIMQRVLPARGFEICHTFAARSKRKAASLRWSLLGSPCSGGGV